MINHTRGNSPLSVFFLEARPNWIWLMPGQPMPYCAPLIHVTALRPPSSDSLWWRVSPRADSLLIFFSVTPPDLTGSRRRVSNHVCHSPCKQLNVTCRCIDRWSCGGDHSQDLWHRFRCHKHSVTPPSPERSVGTVTVLRIDVSIYLQTL